MKKTEVKQRKQRSKRWTGQDFAVYRACVSQLRAHSSWWRWTPSARGKSYIGLSQHPQRHLGEVEPDARLRFQMLEEGETRLAVEV